MDGSRIRKETVADLKISGYADEFAGCVWTVVVSGEKKLRIKKYPCGRGLREVYPISFIELGCVMDSRKCLFLSSFTMASSSSEQKNL